VEASFTQRHVGLPGGDVGPLDFTPAEVKQLWWFLDGAIMNVETRHHLWRSWGLCPRHAWGYAVSEVELRGGLPFSTAILYEDLTRRAAELAGRRLLPWARVRSQLESHDSCFTCDFVAGRAGGQLETDEARWEETAARMNQRRRTVPLVGASSDLWCSHACRLCLGGDGPVCRRHLLEGVAPPGALDDELENLAARLRTFVRSLTVRGAVAGAREQTSWIEALGWFGGWDYARKLAPAPSGERE
jgi:hypothetical protein